jgi:hypothetical protein
MEAPEDDVDNVARKEAHPMASHPYTDDAQLDEHEGGADIIALGDSWFHYPGSNILASLNDALQRNFVIMAYGEIGADVVDYLTPRHLKYWTDRVQTNGARTRAFLLSGGGNDFAGLRDFAKIIRADCSGAPDVAGCWAAGEPAGLLDRVGTAYRDVIARVRAVGFAGPIVLHNYDYAIPTGKGFGNLFGMWLKAPMDLALVPDALRKPLVAELIDLLEQKLATFADPAAQVYLVRSSGTLAEDEWANELHPTREGFDRLVRERWMPVVAPLLGVAVPVMAAAKAKKKPAKAAKKKKSAKPAKKKAKKHV